MYQQLFGMQEEIFRTIASQKRLEIIQLLHGRELTVTQITDMLGIRQSNVSQHLAELRKAKIAIARKRDTSVYYQLADARIAEACELIKSFLQEKYNLDSKMTELLQDETHMFPVVVDPVCHMRISVAHAVEQEMYNGHMYYFCAGGCHATFCAQPKRYANAKELA